MESNNILYVDNNYLIRYSMTMSFLSRLSHIVQIY